MWGLYRIISFERKCNWFVWEGFRTGITAGYRFNTRLVLKWVLIIILVMIKQWHKQQIDLFRMIATSPAATYKFYCKGQIIAFDLAPFGFVLGEHAGFEPYTKVGVIVPVHGTLDIETSREYGTFVVLIK
jgi:hypothetical protein